MLTARSRPIQLYEANAMLTRVSRAESTTITLPGRTLQAYLRADQGISKRRPLRRNCEDRDVTSAEHRPNGVQRVSGERHAQRVA